MDNKSIKIKILAYLLLPIVVMTIFILAMVLYMGHGGVLVEYVGYILFLVCVISVLEIYIFNTKIVKQLQQSDRIAKLLVIQEQGARLLIRRDLELNRANERLRELDQRKSEFLSIVAHQLRTPLSGIKWTLNMLLSGDLGPLSEKQKVFLMKGHESNQRMISLVEDMLSADRVGSGRYSYEFASTQILDLLENVMYEVTPLAEKKHITIEFKPKKDIPKVAIDSEKIRAVIQNILENAIKYTPNNGKISVETVKEGEFVKIEISDTGIGIPKEMQKNIFNRFYRAPNAMKQQADGSGLGLFIVKGIIEKHGGSVWFVSDENKGSSFYFTVKIG